MQVYDLIIIGAGPAGLTAGLYSGRFRLKSLILEKLSPGGQILLSSDIENYPGFPGGIATAGLIDKFKKQVEDVGVEIKCEEVKTLSRSAQFKTPLYRIQTGENSYEARSVIIATGAQSKRLGVSGEIELTGKGVSYCGTCDGPLFKNKEVVVVGGGDRAIEEAIFLTRYAQKVTVIHRRQELRASRILEDNARANQKIFFLLDSVIENISGKGRVEQVQVKSVKSGSLSSVICQGVFIFVGIVPSTSFLNGLFVLDENGFILTDEGMGVPCAGVFACGDCRKKSLYHVVNACGEGAVAADSAHKYLLTLKG